MDLKNKKIVLAGSSNDVGRVLTSELVKNGAYVIALDNNIDSYKSFISINDLLDFVFIEDFDIYNIKEIEPKIKEINEKFGAIDGFVFAAGKGTLKPLRLSKYETLEEMMNANYFTFVEMCRCLTKKNCFSDGGSIVAISSISSIKGLKAKLSYSASKAALNSAVRNLAVELSSKKIRVNAILKGVLTTDRNLEHISAIADINENAIFNNQLLGETEPIEVARLVTFLLSDLVKTMTGTSIILDGGYSL